MLIIIISNEFVIGLNIKLKYYDIVECEGIKVWKVKVGIIYDLVCKFQEVGYDLDIMVEVVCDGVRVFILCELCKWVDIMFYEIDWGFWWVKWDYEVVGKFVECWRIVV